MFQSLQNAGVVVERREKFMAVLGAVDSLQAQDALIADFQLLKTDFEGVIKAILKLCPRLGVVILCPDPDAPPSVFLKSQVVYAGYGEPVGHIMQFLIAAKALRASGQAPGG